jgi:hypothetical protein
LGVEPGQEGQGDRGVDLGEEADHGWEHVAQVCTQLIGRGDAVSDQVFAGPAGTAQRDGGVGVGDQRPEPGAVGAQGVGQHERVEPVVLVSRRSVAAAQVLDLVRGDHYDSQGRAEQGVDDRPVGSLDGDLADAVLAQHVDELAQTGGGVGDRASVDLTAAAVHDRNRMVVASPVDARGDVVGRKLRQCVLFKVLLADFTSASSLLDPVGRHPRLVPLVPGHGCRFAH